MNFLHNAFILLILITALSGQEPLEIEYKLDLTFVQETDTVSALVYGHNVIRILNQWHNSIDTVYIHNNANAHFDPHDSKTSFSLIKSISGGFVSNNQERITTIAICLDSSLEPGDSTELELTFETRLANRGNPFTPTYSSIGDTTIYNLISFYPVLENFYQDGWRPQTYGGGADPHSNPANYDVSFNYPPEYVAGASGFIDRIDTLQNGSLELHSKSPNSNSFGIILSNHFQNREVNIQGLEVQMLYTPGQSENVDTLIAHLETVIPQLETWFGECPRKRLLVSMAYSLSDQAGAIAGTNSIIFQKKMRGRQTFTHELAHQWFGNSLRADENTDAWLNEGFSEYAARLWSTGHTAPSYHPNTGRLSISLWDELRSFRPENLYWLYTDILGESSLGPIHNEDQKLVDWSKATDIVGFIRDGVNIYYRSSNLLQVLEGSLGFNKNNQLHRTYTEQYKNKHVDLDSFLVVLDEIAGSSTALAFEKAVKTAKRPDYKLVYKGTRNINNEWQSTFDISSTGPWSLPVEYIGRSSMDSVLVSGTWFPWDTGKITLLTSEKIKSLSIDPDMHSMDRFRFNNHWPRRMEIHPLISLPGRDAYRIVLRPGYLIDALGQKYASIRILGGLGLNAMPLTSASFRHKFKADLAWNIRTGKPAIFMEIIEPITLIPSSQISLMAYIRNHFNSETLSFKYYGQNHTWYHAGGTLKYSLWETRFRRWEKETSNITDINIMVSERVIFFKQSPNQRSILTFIAGYGRNKNKKKPATVLGELSILGQLDIPFSAGFDLGVHAGLMSVVDNSTGSVIALRSGLLPLIWDQRPGIIPYRGITDQDEEPQYTAVPFGLSIGTQGKEKRFGLRYLIYFDGLLIEKSGGTINDRTVGITKGPCYGSLGLGLESRWAMDIGIYLPLWVSHHPRGQKNWGLRALVRFQKHW